MDINVSVIWGTLAVFVLKFLFVLLICGLLNRIKVRGINFAIAWMMTYLCEIAWMCLLSFMQRLYARELILVCVVSLFIVSVLAIKTKLHGKYVNDSNVLSFCFSDVIPLTIMIMFCVFCIARSFVYFDTTWDALTYEMPRIFLYATNGSLFVDMHSLSKNIMVNEWNGELNAVFYRVITDDNISIPLGNIEIYFYSFVSWLMLGKDMYKEKKYGIYLAYVVMFMPVVVFLAFTCKSDLLAMMTFPLFVVMVLFYWKGLREGKDDSVLLYGIIIVGAVSSGARITVIPAVGMVMLLLLGELFIRKKYVEGVRAIVCAIISYLIGWIRYILNLIYYGNPFERVDVSNEKLEPNVDRLFVTLSDFVEDTVLGENVFAHEGTMWALNKDAGFIGAFVLVGIIIALIYIIYRFAQKKELVKKYFRELSLFACLLSVVVFMFCSMDYFSWSFRYFAPYFIGGMVCLFFIVQYIRSRRVRTALWGLIMVLGTVSAYSTVSMALMKGEVTAHSWEDMLNKEEILRRFAFHEYYVQESTEQNIATIYDDIKKDKKVLLCTFINQGISWCWGDNASNDVYMCLPDEVEGLCLQEEWDVVVVSKHAKIEIGNTLGARYKRYTFEDLEFDVYIKTKAFEEAFIAEKYWGETATVGVYPYDGYYCWLDRVAMLPINMDVSKGARITYAAGTDLNSTDGISTPKVDVYVDGVFYISMDVPYTGEYVIDIPSEFFDDSVECHTFEFRTNAVIGEFNPSGENFCIRLKEIVPIDLE